MKLLKEVLQEIKPTKKEEKEVLGLAKKIMTTINRHGKGVKAILGGSGAKGTTLKSFDADIFVKFKYSIYAEKNDHLSDMLEKILKREFSSVTRLHGSRDYFQLTIKGYTFEIVPILDITTVRMARNITDVSPLHAKWVLKHKKYQNDMRLTKQFCKAAGVYGAESYLQGFSGYVCEILTVHYRGFLPLLNAAVKWKEKQVIDIHYHYKGKDVFREMNLSKLQSPLIVIDPVQKERNAAAALSKEKCTLFIDTAKKFLARPSKEFFFQQKIQNTKKKPFVVILTPLDGKRDVVGSKIVKCIEEMTRIIEQHEFTLLSKNWEWGQNDARIYFYLKEEKLSDEKQIEGPLKGQKEHVERFRAKYGKTKMMGNRLYATIKRFVRERKDLTPLIKKNQYVHERCKKIEVQI